MMYWYGLFFGGWDKSSNTKTITLGFFSKIRQLFWISIPKSTNHDYVRKTNWKFKEIKPLHSTKSHWPGDWTVSGWLFFCCLSRVIAGFLESQRVRPVEGRSLCNSVFVDVEDTLQFPFVNLVSGNHSPEIVLNVLQVYLWHYTGLKLDGTALSSKGQFDPKL